MFSCTFIDDANKTQWFVCYNSGYINLNCYGGIDLQLNYPMNEITEYEEGSSYRDGGKNSWGDLKTRGFTLRSAIRTYIDKDDPEFNAAYDQIGESSGYVDVDFHATEYSGSHYIRFNVPYALAKGLMQLMQGNYTLEGAVHVQRS